MRQTLFGFWVGMVAAALLVHVAEAEGYCPVMLMWRAYLAGGIAAPMAIETATASDAATRSWSDMLTRLPVQPLASSAPASKPAPQAPPAPAPRPASKRATSPAPLPPAQPKAPRAAPVAAPIPRQTQWYWVPAPCPSGRCPR